MRQLLVVFHVWYHQVWVIQLEQRKDDTVNPVNLLEGAMHVQDYRKQVLVHGVQFRARHHLLLLDDFARYFQVVDLAGNDYHWLAVHRYQINIVDYFTLLELHFEILLEAQSYPWVIFDILNDFRFSHFGISQYETQQKSHVIS